MSIVDDFLGPVRRWYKDGIYYAKNDFISLAWAATDDPAMVGKFGWYGPQQIGVEYISQETADKWEAKYGEKP